MKTLRKIKGPVQFRAETTDETLSVDIFDIIGQDIFGLGVTAGMVKQALDDQPGYSSVTLNINSPGGDLFEGVAIYNTLKASGKKVYCNVVGLAASAASIICMAGDEIAMGLGTQLMIHEAISMAYGFASDLRKMADTLDSVTESAADIYVARTGMDKKAVLKMMAAETWMNPEDAVAQGFATSVSKYEAAQVSNSFDLSVFKNVPKELQNAAKTKEVDGEHLTAGDFIYVGDPDKTDTWTLPWHFSTEEKTVSHLRNALARFDQDEIIPESHKAEAHAKLVRIAKEHGIDVSGKKNEAEIKIDLMRKRLEIAKRT